MKNSENCRFCNIISGQYRYPGVDEPIIASDEFVAVASIGALVAGWSLIIPKPHQLSMRNEYKSSMFADFVNFVNLTLYQQYGPLVAFEHGSNKEGSLTGCGTNHAHLHLVPLGESLVPDLLNSGLQWDQCRASEIATISHNNEYLFYTELSGMVAWKDPVGFLHVLHNPLSQFFRKLIAARQFGPEYTDYNRYPFMDNAIQTRRILANSID